MLIQFKIPENNYWEDPNFPSVTVPYGTSTDFFYSGHVGFLICCACEWNRINKKVIFYLVLAISAFMSFIVITFKTHYTIGKRKKNNLDVTCGIIAAHYLSVYFATKEENMNFCFDAIGSFFAGGNCPKDDMDDSDSAIKDLNQTALTME